MTADDRAEEVADTLHDGTGATTDLQASSGKVAIHLSNRFLDLNLRVSVSIHAFCALKVGVLPLYGLPVLLPHIFLTGSKGRQALPLSILDDAKIAKRMDDLVIHDGSNLLERVCLRRARFIDAHGQRDDALAILYIKHPLNKDSLAGLLDFKDRSATNIDILQPKPIKTLTHGIGELVLTRIVLRRAV